MVQRPVERLKRKMEKENLWLFILTLLSKKKRYGKELRKLIEKNFGFLTGMMTAYKVLYLLELDGYVRSKKEGKIVFYEITEKGKKELEHARQILKGYTKMIK